MKQLSNYRFYVSINDKLDDHVCAMNTKCANRLHITKDSLVNLTSIYAYVITYVKFDDTLDDNVIQVNQVNLDNLHILAKTIITVSKRANIEPLPELEIAIIHKNTTFHTKTYIPDKIKEYFATPKPVVLGQVIRCLEHKYPLYAIIQSLPNNRSNGMVVHSHIKFPSKLVKEPRHKIGFKDIGGYKDILQQIREVIELPLTHPELYKHVGVKRIGGILLHGPPGTGKTLLARAVANEINATFLIINGSQDIMTKMLGESEQRIVHMFEAAQQAQPAIIFIDEIDTLAPKRTDDGNDINDRNVGTLLTQMDGMTSRGNVIVIGATNRPNTIDPALRRPGRLDREIYIGPPDEQSRLEILKIHSKHLRLHEDVDLKEISEITNGFTGADLEQVCKEAGYICLRQATHGMDLGDSKASDFVMGKLDVTMKHFKQAVKSIPPSALRENAIAVPNVRWSDIGGLETIKEQLKKTVSWPLLHADLMKKIDLVPPRGVLLYGPPGCGKTLLAKAIANECRANFMSIKGPELISKYVGSSEENVRKIFEKARQSEPCVIFFDELDSLARKRGSSFSSVNDNVVNQLLTEMDGVESQKRVFFIGATNRPELIDDGMMRPGRLTHALLVDVPDEKSRLSILKYNLRKSQVSEDVDLAKIAKMTATYSGADLTAVVTLAKEQLVMQILSKENEDPKITQELLLNALKKQKPSNTPQSILKYRQFKK